MALRIALTGAALLLAVGGFLGVGPTEAGPFNPFGWLFIGLAALIWIMWKSMARGLDSRVGLLDAFSRNFLGNDKR